MKDNTTWKQSWRTTGQIDSPLPFEMFAYMLLSLLTNNLKLCDQQLEYRNQSSYTYTVTIM